jgi:hypothetical protein
MALISDAEETGKIIFCRFILSTITNHNRQILTRTF